MVSMVGTGWSNFEERRIRRVRVRINQARQDSLPRQINLLRLGPGPTEQRFAGADCDDAFALYGQRFRDAELRVRGNDFAVVQDQVRRLKFGRQDRRRNQEN